MQPVTLRSRFGIALTVTVWAICLIVLITLGTDSGLSGDLRHGPAVLLVAYAAWMVFWAPAITIDPGGVSLRNIARTHHITWPAIQRIDTKYALTLFAGGRKFSAWAAPAPSRFSMMNARKQELHSLPESTYGPGMSIGLGDLPKSDSGVAAYHVRFQWEALRDAGHLDSGVVEGTGVRTTVHRRQLIVLAALLALTLVAAYA
jgi:hypothetical protein